MRHAGSHLHYIRLIGGVTSPRHGWKMSKDIAMGIRKSIVASCLPLLAAIWPTCLFIF